MHTGRGMVATVAAHLHPNHMMQGPPKNSYPKWLCCVFEPVAHSRAQREVGYANGDGL